MLEGGLYTEFEKLKDGDFPFLRAHISVLEKILSDGEVPFDELDYEEEYERIYRI